MRSRPGPHLRPLRLLGAALLALAASSCRLNEAREEVVFDVDADSSLLACSRVVVLLGDAQGNLLDTLFDDSLASLGQLRGLSAGPYRGGPARITLLGYRGGALVYGETRIYDGATQRTLALEPVRPAVADPGPAAPRPPSIDSLASDTIVSINDYVRLAATYRDPDGDLAGHAWSCGGGWDSAAAGGHHGRTSSYRTFADSGSRICDLRVWDRTGLSAQGRIRIRVELDPPWADAGDDTTVAAGGRILLHARGDDRFGPIVSREWKIGDADFAPVPWQETQKTAPYEPGELICILRVTDSDGQSALDTMIVTVVTPPVSGH